MSLPSHIRYNLLLNTAYDSTDPNVTLRASRSTPVLPTNSDKYEAVIERFSVPLTNVPNFLCPVVIGQNNPNLTPFQVTLQAGGMITITAGVNDGFVVQFLTAAPITPATVTIFQIPAGLYTPDQLCDALNSRLQSMAATFVNVNFQGTGFSYVNSRFQFSAQITDASTMFALDLFWKGTPPVPATQSAAYVYPTANTGGTLWQTMGFATASLPNTLGQSYTVVGTSAPTMSPLSHPGLHAGML